ncbi:hypothetical protein G9A89_002885, partial [Geosiphon pyriformis]
DSYKPANLEDLNTRINDYLTQEQKLNQEKIQEREAELQKEVQTIQEQKARDLRITGRNFEKGFLQNKFLVNNEEKKT